MLKILSLWKMPVAMLNTKKVTDL